LLAVLAPLYPVALSNSHNKGLKMERRPVTNFIAEYHKGTCTIKFTMEGETWERDYNRYHPMFSPPTQRSVESFFNRAQKYASPSLYGWQLIA
jgi:hypothetical protein